MFARANPQWTLKCSPALNDGTVPLPVDQLLNNVSAADVSSSLARINLAVPVDTSFNGFLVNTGSKLVLIDSRHRRPDSGGRSAVSESVGHDQVRLRFERRQRAA